MNLKTLERLDDLIYREATGTPKKLGERLKITERSVYNYIKYMKEELEAPVVYSKIRQCYFYEFEGKFTFKWMDK